MAKDALDPGPEGNYPNWPRKPDGTPDESRMPTKSRKRRRRRSPYGETHDNLDLRPRDENGNPIEPPSI